MVRCFPCTLNFGQSNNTFYGFCVFSKHHLCLAPRWKIKWPQWIIFYISSLKLLNLVLIPRAKLDGHRGTWTGCIIVQDQDDLPKPVNAFLYEEFFWWKRRWNPFPKATTILHYLNFKKPATMTCKQTSMC